MRDIVSSVSMKNARTLLNHFAMEDQDCIRLLDENASDYTRESTRQQLHYKIKNMASMTDGAVIRLNTKKNTRSSKRYIRQLRNCFRYKWTGRKF